MAFNVYIYIASNIKNNIFSEVLEASNTLASLLLEEGQNHMRKMSVFWSQFGINKFKLDISLFSIYSETNKIEK